MIANWVVKCQAQGIGGSNYKSLELLIDVNELSWFYHDMLVELIVELFLDELLRGMLATLPGCTTETSTLVGSSFRCTGALHTRRIRFGDPALDATEPLRRLSASSSSGCRIDCCRRNA